MIALQPDIHAHVAPFAMEIVLAKSLSNSANPAIIAVIDVLLGIIVPQLANIAVVDSQTLLARAAVLSSRLNCLTMHAHHHLGLAPVRKEDIRVGKLCKQSEIAIILFADQPYSILRVTS